MPAIMLLCITLNSAKSYEHFEERCSEDCSCPEALTSELRFLICSSDLTLFKIIHNSMNAKAHECSKLDGDHLKGIIFKN